MYAESLLLILPLPIMDVAFEIHTSMFFLLNTFVESRNFWCANKKNSKNNLEMLSKCFRSLLYIFTDMIILTNNLIFCMAAGKPIVVWKNYDASPKWLSLVIINKVDLCNENPSRKNFLYKFSNRCLLDDVHNQWNWHSISTIQSKSKLKTPIWKLLLAFSNSNRAEYEGL